MGYSSHSLFSITLKVGGHGEVKEKEQVPRAAAVVEKPLSVEVPILAHQHVSESDDTRKRKANVKDSIKSEGAGMNQV